MKITPTLDSERNKPGVAGRSVRGGGGGLGVLTIIRSNPLLREHVASVVAKRGHACRPAISITLITTPTAATIP